jgi:hypothetical protein
VKRNKIINAYAAPEVLVVSCCLTLACGSRLLPDYQPYSNVACIVRLPLPDYPALARMARFQGTVTASVLLSSAASVEQITTEIDPEAAEGGKLLRSLVGDAIRDASCWSSCGEKTIKPVFHFEITGTPSEYARTTLAFGYPNQFWITTQPAPDTPSSGGRPK